MRIKFSIVTPSYNQGSFIEETIKSIWSQKGNFAIQHIVVDGGSTDKTIKILKKYEKLLKKKQYSLRCKNLEFSWLSERDQGQADALNKGFQLATGDIFAYLNSDDTYCQNDFWEVSKFFKNHPKTYAVFADYWTIDENSKRIKKHRCKSFTRDHLLNKGNPIGQPTVFWRKSVYEKIGEFNISYRFAMDYEYWCRISKFYKFYPLKNVALANFRLHKGSKSVALKNCFWKEQRRASRKNGGKFFSEMLWRRYLEHFEHFLKIYK